MATKLPRIILPLILATFLLLIFTLIQPIQASPDGQTLPILVGNAANQTISQYPVLTILPVSPMSPQADQQTLHNGIALVNDGDFENIVPHWLEVGGTECLPRISNWYTVTSGIVAYQGEQYFWAGGGCQIDGVIYPYNNQMEQTIFVPEDAPLLLFAYLALRVNDDSASVDDYAYIQVNGNEVWRLDLTKANNTGNAWVPGTADLRAYAGQTVNLTVGAVNGELPGLGNIFFDQIGFPGTVTERMEVAGGSLTYEDPGRNSTIVQVPYGTVAGTIWLVLNPQTLLDPAQPLPANVQYANHLFDLDVLSHLIYLPLVMRHGESAVSAPTPPSPIPTYRDEESDGFTFPLPITLTVHYSDNDIAGIDENNLRLYYWMGSEWADAMTTCPGESHYNSNPAENYLQLPVCRLGRFVMGENLEIGD